MRCITGILHHGKLNTGLTLWYLFETVPAAKFLYTRAAKLRNLLDFQSGRWGSVRIGWCKDHQQTQVFRDVIERMRRELLHIQNITGFDRYGFIVDGKV